MNVEEAILELDIEQIIKELAIVCGYLQQEYKKQKELIDKIKEISLGEIDEAYTEERKMSEKIEDILDLIKEYEDESYTKNN